MSSIPIDREASAQKTRLRRTLFAVGGAGALTAVVLIIDASGGVRLESSGLAALLGGFWLVNLAFLAAILTNLNLRLPDPSMTLAQMIWATISSFFILYFVRLCLEMICQVFFF